MTLPNNIKPLRQRHNCLDFCVGCVGLGLHSNLSTLPSPVHLNTDMLNFLARLVALRIAVDLELKSGTADVPSETEFAEPDLLSEVPLGSTGNPAALRACTWHGVDRKKSRLPGMIPPGAVLKLHPVSAGALTGREELRSTSRSPNSVLNLRGR